VSCPKNKQGVLFAELIRQFFGEQIKDTIAGGFFVVEGDDFVEFVLTLEDIGYAFGIFDGVGELFICGQVGVLVDADNHRDAFVVERDFAGLFSSAIGGDNFKRARFSGVGGEGAE